MADELDGAGTQVDETEETESSAPAEGAESQRDDSADQGDESGAEGSTDSDEGSSGEPEPLSTELSTAAMAAGFTEDDARELVSEMGAERAGKYLKRFTDQFATIAAQGAPAAPQGGAAPAAGQQPAGAKSGLGALSALTDAELKAIGEKWGAPEIVDAVVKPLNDKLAAITEALKGLNLEDIQQTVGSVKERQAAEYTRYVDGIFDGLAAKGWAKVLGDAKAPNAQLRKEVHDKAVALRTTVISRGGKMTGEQAVAAILNGGYGDRIGKPEAVTQAVGDLESRVVKRSRQLSIPSRQGGAGARGPSRESPDQVRNRKLSNIRKFMNQRSDG